MFNRFAASGSFSKSAAAIGLISAATLRTDRPELRGSLIPRAGVKCILGYWLSDADPLKWADQVTSGHSDRSWREADF